MSQPQPGHTVNYFTPLHSLLWHTNVHTFQSMEFSEQLVLLLSTLSTVLAVSHADMGKVKLVAR